MIYNLVQYIEDNIPNINLYTDGFAIDAPTTSIAISKTGGNPRGDIGRHDHAIQVKSRAPTTVEAKQNIDKIYLLLENKKRCILPPVSVNGVFYDEIIAYQINALQEPGYIGSDDRNNELYSFNLNVITD